MENDEKSGFALRLTEALENAGIDLRPAVICREFNKHFDGDPVTVYAIRKWLSGESVPTIPKLVALARWLNVSLLWLHYGMEYSKKAELSRYHELITAYEALAPDDRKIALKVMRGLATLKPTK